MPRRAKGLTAAFVDKVTKPGRYADGGGLYLLVRSKKNKFWVHRSKYGELGGGPATGPNARKLVEKRAWASGLNAMIRSDRNPVAERKAAKAKKDTDDAKAKAEVMTFGAVANLLLAAHEAAWSPKHRQSTASSGYRHCATIAPRSWTCRSARSMSARS
jgi:hypothetical protein